MAASPNNQDSSIDSSFDGSKEFNFKWSFKHMQKKLKIAHEDKTTIETKTFKIYGDVGDSVGLKVSIETFTKIRELVLFRPCLVKMFSTVQEDVTIWWYVTLECQKGNNHVCEPPGAHVEFGFKKSTISPSLESTTFKSDKDLAVSRLTCNEHKVVRLNIEILWPEKKIITSVQEQKAKPSNEIENMFSKEKYSDIKLVCRERHFSCHKVVLAARSPVFDAMFSNKENLEVQKGIVNITDMDPDELEVFLKYLYTNKFTDDMKMHAKVLIAAGDKYDVKDLVASAEQLLADITNSDNAIEMLLLAEMHHANMLKKKAMKIIIANYDNVSKLPQWNEFKDSNCDIVNLIEISVENLQI